MPGSLGALAAVRPVVRGLVLVPLLAAMGVLACSGGPAPDGLPRRVRLDERSERTGLAAPPGRMGRPQERRLSCESRSACDLLAFHGIHVAEGAFLASLPRADDPERGFVGDPDGPAGRLPPEGYGVHAPPVAERLGAYGLEAAPQRGVDLAWLRREVAAGRPVIVWATADLVPRPARRMRSGDGRPFEAVPGEHTFLFVGYGPGRVHLLDPASGRVRAVETTRFDAAWASLGRMAVSARPR